MATQDIVQIFVIGSIYTLFALGLTLSWGILNILNLAHGAIFMFTGVVAYWLTKDTAISFWLLLPIAMAVGGVIAVLLELVAYRPIRRHAPDMHAAELSTMIASIAGAAAIVGLGEIISGNTTVGVNPGSFDERPYNLLGLRVTNLEIIIVIAAVTFATLLAVFVKRSRQGRALRALAEDPYACGLLGISSLRLSIGTMFVSGALAGVAGLLLTIRQSGIDPRSGDPFLLKAFAVIILGGVGSVPGTILAAFILGLAEVLTAQNLTGAYTDAVAFALIIILLLVRPQGIFPGTAWKRA